MFYEYLIEQQKLFPMLWDGSKGQYVWEKYGLKEPSKKVKKFVNDRIHER